MYSILFTYLNSLCPSGAIPKVPLPPDELLPSTLHYRTKDHRYYLTRHTPHKKHSKSHTIDYHITRNTITENLTRIANDLHYLMLRQPNTHPHTKLASLYFYFTVFCQLAAANTPTHSHLLKKFLLLATPDALADIGNTLGALATIVQALQNEHAQNRP